MSKQLVWSYLNQPIILKSSRGFGTLGDKANIII